MKKFLCIFLSALLVCALFIIPASADEASLSYTIHRGTTLNLTSLADINALPTASLPVSYDGTAGSLGNSYFFVLSLPSFVSLNSLDVSLPGNSGVTQLMLYGPDNTYLTTLSSSSSFDLSSYDNISSLVLRTSVSSGNSITSAFFDLDYVSPSVWNGIGSFITGLFGAIGSIVTGITGQPVILAFVILLPLTAIGLGYLFRFLGKKRKRR